MVHVNQNQNVCTFVQYSYESCAIFVRQLQVLISDILPIFRSDICTYDVREFDMRLFDIGINLRSGSQTSADFFRRILFLSFFDAMPEADRSVARQIKLSDPPTFPYRNR